MLQLAQGLGLDLADALAGDRELLADFLQRVVGVHAIAVHSKQPFEIDVRYCLICIRYEPIVGRLSRYNNSTGFDPQRTKCLIGLISADAEEKMRRRR